MSRPMSSDERPVWVCDYVDCGHVWLAVSEALPGQCAKCRRRGWNRPGGVAVSVPRVRQRQDVAVVAPVKIAPAKITPQPVPAAVCGHCGQAVAADPRNPRLWYCAVCDRQLKEGEVKR
jgi:hypothetical protein